MAQRQSAPRAVGRVAGRVRLSPVVARVRPIESARTGIIPVDEPPTPVFVDPSGVRRRRLRRLSYGVACVVAVLLLTFWLSQLPI